MSREENFWTRFFASAPRAETASKLVPIRCGEGSS